MRPVADVIDLSWARLAVTWRSVGTHQILAVRDDGAVWFWALATIGPGSDVVGTFRTRLPDDRRPDLDAVAGLPDRAGAAVPGQLGLTVSSGDRSGWVPLGGADASTVTDLVLPLVAAARTAPVAAARLVTHLVTAPTGARAAGFSLTSVGTEPVTALLDRDTLALTTFDGDWLPLTPPRMGLVGAAGELLDGIYQAATIPPGSAGACSVPLDGDEDRQFRTGSLRGAVTLVGPWAASPAVPFEIAGAVASPAG